MVIIVLVFNSAAMFSYPPCPWIPTRDNLVSNGSGSISAMSIQSSVGTMEEQQIAIGSGDVVAAFRDVRPRIIGHHHTRFVIRPGRHLKPWGRFGGLAHELESIATESNNDRGSCKDAPVTSGGDCALHAIGGALHDGDDDPHMFGGGVIGGGGILRMDVGSSVPVAGGGLVASAEASVRQAVVAVAMRAGRKLW
jgi:hypothetical protein